jgi:hypothetical protein
LPSQKPSEFPRIVDETITNIPPVSNVLREEKYVKQFVFSGNKNSWNTKFLGVSIGETSVNMPVFRLIPE